MIPLFGWIFGGGGWGRSGRWSTVRREHLERNPRCAVCGRDKKLEVHHIRPYQHFPELELDPDNLLTMCADPCHLMFGHLGNFRSWNPDVVEDAKKWLEKVRHRPFDSQ